MKKALMTVLAMFLMLFAFANIAAATGWMGYQPELPNLE